MEKLSSPAGFAPLSAEKLPPRAPGEKPRAFLKLELPGFGSLLLREAEGGERAFWLQLLLDEAPSAELELESPSFAEASKLFFLSAQALEEERESGEGYLLDGLWRSWERKGLGELL